MGERDKLKLAGRGGPQGGQAGGAIIVPGPAVPETEFIHVEKQIIEVGFFTPTSKELKTTRVKTVQFKRAGEDGQTRETRVKIVTGGYYGLPGTADQDKWLALQKLINNTQRRTGEVTNPITFSSWELLSMLGVHRRSGRNYEIVSEWLDRMVATTIEVSGEGDIDGQRRFGKDRIKVFDRAVSFGRELSPGVKADKNYVWLSQWQLDNLNTNFVLTIDLETYRALKNPTAKALVPLLQIWLYASQAGSVFSKSYEDVCQLLGIKQWMQKSKIEEKLGPSLNELQRHGYLTAWGVDKLRGKEGYKLILKHGPKFFRDQAENQRRQGQLAGRKAGDEEARLTAMLVERGVIAAVAQQLVSGCAPGQFIEDQVEWYDELLARKGAHYFTNAPGLLVTLIKSNVPIDPNFQTRRMRRLRAEYEARRRAQAEAEAAQEEAAGIELSPSGDEPPPRQPDEYDLYLLENQYREYKRQEVARHIRDMQEGARAALKERARILYGERYRDASKVLRGPAAAGIIEGLAEEIVAPDVAVLSLEEFIERQGNVTDDK